ncbi:MAG: MalY/PatB family protein [Oscillospiraceae bacterium]|nr:pyridoxal phosphate-dependent aminotransferase [Oscillospiraceae bacterium]MDY4191249.1 MalY/PatB family protein [Oscillospiraceae bacterium]
MSVNFDRVIDRKNTCCIKYDCAEKRGKPADILPMWVADMDFPTAPAVVDALREVVDFGIYGYTDYDDSYVEAVQNWFGTRFGWKPEAEWLTITPGVVCAVAAAVRAFTNEGEGVLIQTPVYYPFGEAIRGNGRRVVENPLVLRDGRYTMDFEDLENKILSEKVRLLILCSPHNPVGRVWNRDELTRLGDLCHKYGVVVISDEIHCDFTYPGITHTVLCSLKKEYEENVVTCTAPSKTFNLAGLQHSNIFIPNPELRARYQKVLNELHIDNVGIMGLAACRAAYRHGAPWLEELKAYLASNLDYMREFIRTRLPGVRLVEPEGTYLVWVDFRELDLSPDALEDLMVNKCRLWLDRGNMFGQAGEGFERFNIACPRATLEEALTRVEKALKEL